MTLMVITSTCIIISLILVLNTSKSTEGREGEGALD